LKDDIDAACAVGLLSEEARSTGLLYWLGLCQILMINLVERKPDKGAAATRISEMLFLGLTGLGVDATTARQLARTS
jgi:hypothetical protein